MGGFDAYLIPVVDGVAYGLLLFTVAAGLMLVFAVGGVLNLAHGILFVFGAYAAAAMSDGSWIAWGGAILVGTVAGAGGGGLVAAALAPLHRRGHLTQALLSMGLALIAADLLRTAFGPTDRPIVLPAPLTATATVAGHTYPVYRLGFIAAASVLAAAGWWVLTRTRTGAVVRAAVDDPDMLATVGTNPRAVNRAVIVTSGGLAGLTGALGAPILGAGPTTATTVLLISLVVVVLGGMRSVPATLLAAFAVGQVQTLGVTTIPWAAPYLLFAAMAAALVLRRHEPNGRPA